MSTVSTKKDEYEYVFYLGFDASEKLYTSDDVLTAMKHAFCKFNLGLDITVFGKDITSGHLTKMWNILAEKALCDGCDYFFQCGDDVELLDNGWITECVSILKSNNDNGMTGPNDIDYPRILTQTFVSRKHVTIFGHYFPEDIINWYCDDWINAVYRNSGKFYKSSCRCVNRGGDQRYNIVRLDSIPNFNTLVSTAVETLIRSV